jgi:predicted 3-demethylubiquinone-9 3-methyltransferase (glyoxalase superfamily)
MATMQKISSCLWFNTEAEEAVKFYTSVFKNSKVGAINRFGEEGKEIHGQQPGSVMTIEFWLNDHQFLALNGGPQFKFNEAVSFVINCEDQSEIDYYWEKLTKGGDPKAQVCGWLKDKYGLSWQVFPKGIDKMFKDNNSKGYQRAMHAMMQMKKIDIATMERAYEGKEVEA